MDPDKLYKYLSYHLAEIAGKLDLEGQTALDGIISDCARKIAEDPACFSDEVKV